MRIAFDEILCTIGRVANTTGYGLEEPGIPTAKAGTVAINEYLQTIYPNIYAAGNWKRAHAPAHLLKWVGRYHAWMRGGPVDHSPAADSAGSERSRAAEPSHASKASRPS